MCMLFSLRMTWQAGILIGDGVPCCSLHDELVWYVKAELGGDEGGGRGGGIINARCAPLARSCSPLCTSTRGASFANARTLRAASSASPHDIDRSRQ